MFNDPKKLLQAHEGSSRLWLSLLTFAVVLAATINFAHARPSNITNENGPAGEITFGCVIKRDTATVYIRNIDKPSTNDGEERAVIANFPSGFEKEIVKVGQGFTRFHSLIVMELLYVNGRQMLRGYLVDGHGWPANGTLYVYPQDWDCSLLVNPSN